MKIMLVALFLTTALVRADFASDQYTDHPDVLLRIVSAAEQNARLKSNETESTVFYLRKAEYVGPLNAPFGTVYVAQLFYVRSAPQGSKLPARGHTFVAFLDDKFKIRVYWEIDGPDEPLSVAGGNLMKGKEVVFDYAHLPKSGKVTFDGKVQGVPQWDK